MGNITLDNLPKNYRFDAENRLVGQSPGSFSYMYDGDGARVRKSNGSVTTLFWRDLAGKVLAETDGSGNPQQDYIYLNGAMIARSDVTHGHPRLDYYYMHDHLGTTRMITNPVGGDLLRCGLFSLRLGASDTYQQLCAELQVHGQRTRPRPGHG